MVIKNSKTLAVHSIIETYSPGWIFSGDQIIECNWQPDMDEFICHELPLVFGTNQVITPTFEAQGKLRIVSKNLPVMHVMDEDDELVDRLTPFITCNRFKERWHSPGLYCYFGIADHLCEKFAGLPDYSVRHYSSLLHDFWLGQDHVFHADFEKNYMHVYCKRDGEFLFYNKLYFENEVDVHYHLALIEKEVFNNQKSKEIIFSGEIDKESKILKTLRSYYDQIRFINENGLDFVLNERSINPLYFDKYLMQVCV